MTMKNINIQPGVIVWVPVELNGSTIVAMQNGSRIGLPIQIAVSDILIEGGETAVSGPFNNKFFKPFQLFFPLMSR